MSDIVFDPREGHPQRKAILAVLCLSLVLIVASVSSLNVAIPSIVEALDASQTEQLWILDSYALVFAGLLLPAGALGDRYGRKGALLVGMTVFGLLAIVGSLVSSAPLLIAVRAAMGIGAALIMPATLSIITNVFPAEERGKAIAVWAGFAGAGGAIGSLSSGALLEAFEWEAVFLVNVPIVLLAIALIARLVPTSRDESHAKLDPVGSVLSIIGLVSLVFAIIEGPEKGWTSAIVLGGFAVAVVGLTAFVLWELRNEHPMLDPRLFKLRGFSTGAITITLAFAVMFGMFYVMTLYLQFALGYSALGAAVRILPFAVTMVIVSPRSPLLVERFGQRTTVVAGLLIQASGFLLASRLDLDTPYVVIALSMMLMAGGMGMLMPPTTAAIVASLPPDKAGVGSAVNDTTREVGGAIGIAVLGSVLASGYRSGLGGIVDLLPAEARGFVEDSIAGALRVRSRRRPALGQPARRHRPHARSSTACRTPTWWPRASASRPR